MRDTQEIMALFADKDEDSIREGAHLAGDAKLEEAVPSLILLLQSDKLGIVEAAERALSKIGGPRVVQGLIPLLRSDNATLRNSAMELLRVLGNSDIGGLFRLLYDDDADIRIFASDIIGNSGSLNAVPPLAAALLNDPEVNVRYQAAVSLGELGFPQAVDSLLKALHDEEWVQFAVIEALIKIRAESCLDPLMKALDDSTPLVASMIVEALGEIGNIKAVPSLMKGLCKAPLSLRGKIAKAIVQLLGPSSLGLMDVKDRTILKEALLAVLRDTDEDAPLQDVAIVGLSALGGPESSAAIIEYARRLDPDKDQSRIEEAVTAIRTVGFNETIENAMSKGDEDVKSIAAQAICFMDDPRGIALLKKTFWDCGRDLQRLYIECLSERCTHDDLDFFLKVLAEHSDGDILKGALRYLGKNADYESAGEVIFRLTEHSYNDVKEAAIEAGISLNSPKMLERFREMAHSSNPVTRMMGIYAIGRQDSEGSADILMEAIGDSEPEVRRQAIEALCRQCPLAKERFDHILASLSDESRDVRLAVLNSVGGCPDDSVIPLLKRALEDQDIWVKARAVEALGRHNTGEVISLLVQLLNDESQLVVIKSIEALSQIGGQEAFSAVLNLVVSEDPEIQQMAEAAVEHMRAGERS